MSFSATGDCQLVSQIYKYKKHRIVCNVKVLPTPVTHFERESRNDFHWMTADRWTRIESGLWRLFENLTDWEDAQKLNTELLIDHINVHVQATEKPHPAALSLSADFATKPQDLNLDLQLRYITHEDTTILGVHATKRKHATEAQPNGTSIHSSKHTAKTRAKPTQSRPKHIDADDDDDDNDDVPAESQLPSKVKRQRRSISQGSGTKKSLANGRNSRQENVKKGIQTPPKRSSRASSVESKPARRSGRSPMRPGHFKNFVVGEAVSRKPKIEKKVTKSKAKKASPSSTEESKVEEMDGARFDALQRLDSMLDIPKPREVEILLLENMTEQDVLDTFETYKGDFDTLFKERQNKQHTTNYMSIDHMHIMDILNKSIHDSMIKKLAENYSKRSAHTSLLINGLLPLWILRLFMDTYKLSQPEALCHIKDQLKYGSYLKALNDEPLCSDLD
ncbi:uncharacterized protein Dana_GF16135 [Drosophila ananassae]|uniref:Uncharacterized protein n=1 Tax=Drosophila ananassae TaxID=7217 RepID=B3M023_DROAN|nr:uncharacterized protein CG4951 [Drosophila ananassae]EDV44213.1 uncharacterized protein Dana_GF16135 [Drosophila ananassae]